MKLEEGNLRQYFPSVVEGTRNFSVYVMKQGKHRKADMWCRCVRENQRCRGGFFQSLTDHTFPSSYNMLVLKDLKAPGTRGIGVSTQGRIPTVF